MTKLSGTYSRGVSIVVGTVLCSAIVCWFGVDRGPAVRPRAAQDLGSSPFPLGSFELTDQTGRAVSNIDLENRVWVAAFIFTRCPLSCPRISTAMKGLQDRLSATKTLLVSISVDPEHDTPAVLDAYSHRFGAKPDRWWFLTGTKASIQELVQNRFKLPLAESAPSAEVEAFSHSDRLALVDRGRVVGFFETSEPTALDDLVSRARRLSQPGWVLGLPAVNASLNALCALFLVAGWFLIRQRHTVSRSERSENVAAPAYPTGIFDRPGVRAHIVCMSLAVATSAIFLSCYLLYHYQAGSMPFPHGGLARWLYFTILLSHTLLATFGVVPLVSLTLFRALSGDFIGHAKIAKTTYSIWLYVSVTGVVIYAMLYHWPLAVGSISPLS